MWQTMTGKGMNIFRVPILMYVFLIWEIGKGGGGEASESAMLTFLIGSVPFRPR